MNADNMTLEILSPEKSLFKGKVSYVYIPGKKAPFVILYNHAPIMSALDKGVVKWKSEEAEHSLVVASGFVEAKNNNVTICVEPV